MGLGLDRDALENELKDIFDDESEIDVIPAEARARQAKRIADAIDAFVRSGKVVGPITGVVGPGGAITGTMENGGVE